MAKWNDLPWREDVYKAAELWRETCFFNDGSIFDNGNIWTRENILTLKERILDDSDTSDQNFYEKLELQLYRAPRDSVLLMAEIMWFIYLFPIGRQPVPDSPNKRIRLSTKWETKRKEIAEILSWKGAVLPEKDVTNTDALCGMGKSGQQYVKLYGSLEYFLPVMLDWKRLPLNKRSAYRDKSRCWDLAELLDKDIGKRAPPWRHALLFFLCPEKFERMVSKSGKCEALGDLIHMIPKTDIKEFLNSGGYKSLLAMDKALYKLREALMEFHGTTNLDFYRSPVDGTWGKPNTDKSK